MSLVILAAMIASPPRLAHPFSSSKEADQCECRDDAQRPPYSAPAGPAAADPACPAAKTSSTRPTPGCQQRRPYLPTTTASAFWMTSPQPASNSPLLPSLPGRLAVLRLR